MDSVEMQAELNGLQAQITSLTLVCAALIQTHPDHTAMQLQLTSVLEQQLGNGVFGRLLTEQQQAQVRDAVERFGSLQPRKRA